MAVSKGAAAEGRDGGAPALAGGREPADTGCGLWVAVAACFGLGRPPLLFLEEALNGVAKGAAVGAV